jgi:TPR repeat protein
MLTSAANGMTALALTLTATSFLLLSAACATAQRPPASSVRGGTDAAVPDATSIVCRPDPIRRRTRCQIETDPSNRDAGRRTCERECSSEAPDACVLLAHYLEFGWGGPPDDRRARRLLDVACMAGDRVACDDLGGFLLAPPEADTARAFSLFRRACSLGNCFACLHLGEMLLSGRGVPRDCPTAVRLYERACEQDEPWSCARLVRLYDDGADCLPPDADKARIARERLCAQHEQCAPYLCRSLTADRHTP